MRHNHMYLSADQLRNINLPAFVRLAANDHSVWLGLTGVTDDAFTLTSSGDAEITMPNEAFEQLFTTETLLLWRDPTPKARTLGPAMSGADVERLQANLRSVGRYSGPLTGQYDEATAAAVAGVQADTGFDRRRPCRTAGAHGVEQLDKRPAHPLASAGAGVRDQRPGLRPWRCESGRTSTSPPHRNRRPSRNRKRRNPEDAADQPVAEKAAPEMPPATAPAPAPVSVPAEAVERKTVLTAELPPPRRCRQAGSDPAGRSHSPSWFPTMEVTRGPAAREVPNEFYPSTHSKSSRPNGPKRKRLPTNTSQTTWRNATSSGEAASCVSASRCAFPPSPWFLEESLPPLLSSARPWAVSILVPEPNAGRDTGAHRNGQARPQPEARRGSRS